jgi:AcrR family transcriptional regulator
VIRKQTIITTATKLFARQGFDGTTTLQIATEAGVTEPLIYYHFKGKDDLFTHILGEAFGAYFARLDALESPTKTEFEKIERLFTLHFQVVEEMPDEALLIVSACPAKLRDPENICAQNIARQRKLLIGFLVDCLKTGIRTGEFCKVPTEATANLLLGLVNGLVRQRSFKMEALDEMHATAVDFCRRSLLAAA